jgi:hypothetical protein
MSREREPPLDTAVLIVLLVLSIAVTALFAVLVLGLGP